MSDLTTLGAHAAARAIAAGELTAEALVTACLERIDARDSDIGAWVHVDPDAALAQARARDAEPPRGPLHGVPVGVKDIIDTAGQPTERGSPIHAGRVPDRDAACVAGLRRAGAVVLGKTVTTEFATSHPGGTANPHDLTRTPGGSSSGSAAAVADGMVPLALGTQTSGSIVRPAAFCGVFGLKPTLGAVPLGGVQPLSPTLDTLGVLARDIDDLVMALPALGGATVTAPLPTDPVRIGFSRTPLWESMEDKAAERVLDVVEELERAGVVTERIGLPASFAGLVEAQLTIFAVESAQSLRREYEDHFDRLSEFLKGWLARGRATPRSEYLAALDHRARVGQAVAPVWDVVDALLVPAVPGEAPVGLDHTGDPVFCRGWTTLGVPAVAVPGLSGPEGLPLGLQVVAPPGHDAVAVAAGAALRSLG